MLMKRAGSLEAAQGTPPRPPGAGDRQWRYKRARSLEAAQGTPHSSPVLETDSGAAAGPMIAHICAPVPASRNSPLFGSLLSWATLTHFHQ